MGYVYFFKKDGMCRVLTGLMRNKVHETYLHGPVPYKGEMVKFYLILHWLHRNDHGADLGFLDKYNLNYVNTINDLPTGAGALSAGYDVDLSDLKVIQEKNIPFIDKSCPRIKRLRKQLLSGNPDTHQFVFMISEHHLVYECFKCAFPRDIIIVDPDNYRERIVKLRNEKPVHLFVYGVFRPKEVQSVIEFINERYPHPLNNMDGYNETRCCWTRQGLLEEIQLSIQEEELDEVWVICTNVSDTSTRSIIKEIEENKAQPVIIKNELDIPMKMEEKKRVGVLIAPIPSADKGRKLVSVIKERFCG